MKVLTVILLLLVALMYAFFGIGYLLGGTLSAGLGALMGGMMGTMSQMAGSPEAAGAATAGIHDTAGQFAAWLALAGVCYWIASIGALGAAVRLGRPESPMPLIGGGLVLATETVSIARSGFSIPTGIAVAAGVMALALAVRNLRTREDGLIPIADVFAEMRGAAGILAGWLVLFAAVLGLASNPAILMSPEAMTAATNDTTMSMEKTMTIAEPAPAPAGSPAPAAAPATSAPIAPVAAGPSTLTGQIQGRPLTKPKARLNYGSNMLEIREGEDFFPDLAVGLFLQGSGPESLAGREHSAHGLGGELRGALHVQVRPPGENLPKTSFVQVDDAQVRVSFGALEGDQLPGRISLKSGDTAIEGTFVATVINHDGRLPTAPGDDSFDAVKYAVRQHFKALLGATPHELESFADLSKTQINGVGSAKTTARVVIDGKPRDFKVSLTHGAQGWKVTEPASIGG